MAEVEVTRVGEDESGFTFEVRVQEAGDRSRHHVTMSRADFETLGKGAESPEGFVRDCFRFLLDREPKESILPSFDLREIGRYFPEFEREIGRPQKSR